MPTLKATLVLELDSVPLANFPLVRRLELDESQSYRYEEPDDADAGTFNAIPADKISDLRMLFVDTDQQITLRVDNQTDAGIIINAGGFALLFDVNIDAGAGANNAKINNTTGNTANVEGIAGGT